jgi:hypothetical protein
MWNGNVRLKLRIHILVKLAMNICIFHEMRVISPVEKKNQIVQKSPIPTKTAGNVVNSWGCRWEEQEMGGVAVPGGRIHGAAK